MIQILKIRIFYKKKFEFWAKNSNFCLKFEFFSTKIRIFKIWFIQSLGITFFFDYSKFQVFRRFLAQVLFKKVFFSYRDLSENTGIFLILTRFQTYNGWKMPNRHFSGIFSLLPGVTHRIKWENILKPVRMTETWWKLFFSAHFEHDFLIKDVYGFR